MASSLENHLILSSGYIFIHGCFSSQSCLQGGNILLTRWWFQICFNFYPYLERWSNLTHICEMGWFNHQLDKHPHRLDDSWTSSPWNTKAKLGEESSQSESQSWGVHGQLEKPRATEVQRQPWHENHEATASSLTWNNVVPDWFRFFDHYY